MNHSFIAPILFIKVQRLCCVLMTVKPLVSTCKKLGMQEACKIVGGKNAPSSERDVCKQPNLSVDRATIVVGKLTRFRAVHHLCA